jgi:hypothetical protein
MWCKKRTFVIYIRWVINNSAIRNLTFTEVMWTIFGKDFTFDFDFQINHSIEKIVLIRSALRPRSLARSVQEPYAFLENPQNELKLAIQKTCFHLNFHSSIFNCSMNNLFYIFCNIVLNSLMLPFSPVEKVLIENGWSEYWINHYNEIFFKLMFYLIIYKRPRGKVHIWYLQHFLSTSVLFQHLSTFPAPLCTSGAEMLIHI